MTKEKKGEIEKRACHVCNSTKNVSVREQICVKCATQRGKILYDAKKKYGGFVVKYNY